ncbi:ketoacyl-ACP synthase III [Amycolatopsis rubida]|uniref:Ketoacyl-ACP synthase III n=1 Tax=Amycolatopsis rubida TaxID=112413 RepID=A0ABX0C196_9PSEU|nr:ketoacyl-ACP synthase III [Amycolatopsis sp. M39]MYW93736.1 hypothetical protein [Amycolatopsis rubida]NEC58723.1 ketoacyl-ACP synthase III [Amycolatopsis rubida]OAP22916.1 3-oxoacyl-[acyl-carrier-protein] synthase 3 [Amycolatopsis sp. M39]
MGTVIIGIGRRLPEQVITNPEIERSSGYDRARYAGVSLDEWSRSQHGGRTRRVARPPESTSSLAAGAARAALDDAAVSADDIDVIVLSTFTGGRVPPAASHVQGDLGCSAKFLQLDSACTGFVDAMLVADGLLRCQGYQRALVVAADVSSPLFAPDDWVSRTVFGDGAGAVVVEHHRDDSVGIIAHSAGSDGHLSHYVTFREPGGGHPPNRGRRHLRLRYARIGPWAVDRMVHATRTVLDRAGATLSDVSLIVPHQTSDEVLTRYGDVLGYPRDRVVSTYAELGNTAAASIPITLVAARRQRALRPGQLILMPAVGAGMAWGALAYRSAPPARGELTASDGTCSQRDS